MSGDSSRIVRRRGQQHRASQRAVRQSRRRPSPHPFPCPRLSGRRPRRPPLPRSHCSCSPRIFPDRRRCAVHPSISRRGPHHSLRRVVCLRVLRTVHELAGASRPQRGAAPGQLRCRCDGTAHDDAMDGGLGCAPTDADALLRLHRGMMPRHSEEAREERPGSDGATRHSQHDRHRSGSSPQSRWPHRPRGGTGGCARVPACARCELGVREPWLKRRKRNVRAVCRRLEL